MAKMAKVAPKDSQPLAFEGFDPNSGGYYNALVVGDGYGQLPPGGAPGQILVKTGRADFDAIWATAYITGDGGDGTGTGPGGDIILDSIAPIRVSGGGSAWTISIDTASPTRPGSMSAADKRRLDSLPTWRGDTPPVRALEGDLWWNTVDGTGYILYNDGSSQQWVAFTPTGGAGEGKEVYIGSTPPAGVPPESLWWDSSLGRLFILYDDGTSEQWVDASPDGAGGSAKEVYSGRVPPVGVPPDTIWWSSVDGTGYILFDDGSGEQWVALTPQGSSENGSVDEGNYGA